MVLRCGSTCHVREGQSFHVTDTHNPGQEGRNLGKKILPFFPPSFFATPSSPYLPSFLPLFSFFLFFSFSSERNKLESRNWGWIQLTEVKEKSNFVRIQEGALGEMLGIRVWKTLNHRIWKNQSLKNSAVAIDIFNIVHMYIAYSWGYRWPCIALFCFL